MLDRVLCGLRCRGFGSKKSAVYGVLCEGSKQILDMYTYNDWGVLQEDGKIAIWVVKVEF